MIDAASTRRYLNGLWQFAPLADPPHADTPPDAWSSTPIQVPGYWNTFPASIGGDWDGYDNFGHPAEWRDARAGWYRCSFRHDRSRLPDGGRVRLTFDAVAGLTRVLLNDRRLGENHDLFLPFFFDVTDAVREGDNKLLVFVGEPQQENGLWLQPPGSWVGWHLRGIWQDVYLDCLPGCFIDDVFVQPSVDRMELTADVTVRNDSDRPWSGRVCALVRDGDSHVLEFEPALVEVAPGQSVVVRIRRPWPDAVLWSPGQPKLYHLHAHLKDTAGALRHETSARFGFRQFSLRGTDFVLNGRKIRLFGDSWHYMGAAQQNADYARTWFRLVKETGGNSVRLHAMPHPPCYLDVADEMGILIIDESAIYGSAGTLALTDERLWERTRDHVRRLVLRDRNHPSVILWSADNEVVWKGGAEVFPHLLSLATEIRRHDPTRPVSFDENDSDLGGGAAIHGGHYGTPAHWNAAWKRTKPLMVNEFCSLYFGGPNECSPYVGDAGYADFERRWAGAGEEAAAMFWRLRELGAASITPWNINWYSMRPMPARPVDLPSRDPTGPGMKIRRIGEHSLTLNYGYDPQGPPWRPNPAYELIREAYTAQAFHVKRPPHHWFGGGSASVNVTVFNDLPSPAVLELHWSLNAGGKVLDCGSVTADLGSYENTERCVAPGIPVVEVVVEAELTLELRAIDSPGTRFTKTYAVTIWPAVRLADGGGPVVAVAGGTQVQRGRLRESGFTVVDCAGPDAPLPDEVRAVVLAEGGNYELTRWIESPAIVGCLERGGTVLVLPGGTAADAASPMTPIERAYSRAWVRIGDHPLTRGLGDDLFRDWPPDGAVARQVYGRPTGGNTWPLLDVGDANDGMRYTPLLLVPRGRGAVVFCGMDLLGRSGDVPAAATLLSRILQYTHEKIEAGGGVRLRDAGNAVSVADVTFAENGGTLLLSGLTPETVSHVQSLLGLRLDLREDVRYNVARATDSTLLAGVNNYDLCWIYQAEKAPIGRYSLTMDDARYRTLIHTVATRWEDFQPTAEQHKVAMMIRRIEAFDGPRAVMVEIPRDRGRVILSLLRLDEAPEAFAAHAARIRSQLLTNLGVTGEGDLLRGLSPDEQFADRQGYIKQWLVLGAFPSPQANPIDVPFIDEEHVRPVAGLTTAGRTWAEAASGWPQINLRRVLGEQARDHSAAYAAVYVYSPRDCRVLLNAPEMVSLLTGSDDGTKVWLNGRPIGRFDFVRPLVMDQNRMDNVPLNKGWNLLLVKLAQHSGQWQFTARFIGPSGPVGDLKYSLAAPGGGQD